MKKHYYLLLLSIFCTSSIFAQNQFFYGAKAGLNFTGLHSDSAADTHKFGWHAGAVAEYEIAPEIFSLQAELLYNQKGQDQVVDFRSHYIDLPVMAKIYLWGGFNVEIGPQIGFLVGEKWNFSYVPADAEVVTPNLRTFDAALNAGIGYQFSSPFFIQARYSHGLTAIENRGDLKNLVIGFSIGYFFNR